MVWVQAGSACFLAPWSGTLEVKLFFPIWFPCQRWLQGSAGTQGLVASFPGPADYTKLTTLWTHTWERWKIKVLWLAPGGESSGFLQAALPHHQTRQDPICSWAQGGAAPAATTHLLFPFIRAFGHTATATATSLCCQSFDRATLAIEPQSNHKRDMPDHPWDRKPKRRDSISGSDSTAYQRWRSKPQTGCWL